MKRCPNCNRITQDDAQKFCVHDGGMLVDAGGGAAPPPGVDLNRTIAASPPQNPEGPSAGYDPLKTMVSPPPPRAPSQKLDADQSPFKTIAAPPPIPEFPKAEPPTPPRAASTPLTPAATLPPPPPQQAAPPPPQHAAPPPQQAFQPQQTLQPPPQFAPPHMAAQPAPPLAQQPPRQKSKLPWIIAGIVVFLLLLLGAGGVIAFLFLKDNSSTGARANRNTNANVQTSSNTSEAANTSVANSANENAATNENANTNTNTNAEVPPPPNSEKFTNARAKLSGKLAEHYVDFSFYYPKNWELDRQAGTRDSSNFVKVERRLPPDLTQENFAVSYYDSQGTMEADRARFPELAKTLSDKLAKTFPEYQKVSEGETRVRSLDGYEFRFQSVSRNPGQEDIHIWGRVVFLPPGVAGGQSGVTLLMLTTSLAKELSGVEDVGVKGELPVILNSFRLGASKQ